MLLIRIDAEGRVYTAHAQITEDVHVAELEIGAKQLAASLQRLVHGHVALDSEIKALRRIGFQAERAVDVRVESVHRRNVDVANTQIRR